MGFQVCYQVCSSNDQASNPNIQVQDQLEKHINFRSKGGKSIVVRIRYSISRRSELTLDYLHFYRSNLPESREGIYFGLVAEIAILVVKMDSAPR